jgi:hypothetical protein
MTHPFEVALARAKQYRASLADRAPRPSIAAAALEARFERLADAILRAWRTTQSRAGERISV